MKRIKVKELMIPISEFPTVREDSTLYDVVLALSETQRRIPDDRDRYHAVVVLNDQNLALGKVDSTQMILGLESGYKQIGDLKAISHTGFTPEFIKSMITRYDLWQGSLTDVCRKAFQVKVGDIVEPPVEGEYIEEEASLDEGIHQLVMGGYQSLLVRRKERIVGIFRLSDVFSEVCRTVRACNREDQASDNRTTP